MTATLTANELAAELKVTPETVRLRAKAGDIPGMQIGRLWRFDLDEVKQALKPSADPWAQSSQSRARRRK